MEDSDPKSGKKQRIEFSEHKDGVNATSAVEYDRFPCSNTDHHCLQCAMKFSDNASYTLHTESNEHAIMNLIAGVAYVDQDEMPREFPELCRCVLCDFYSSDYETHKLHFRSRVHIDLAIYVRSISFWKETHLIGVKCEKKRHLSLQELVDLKYTPSNYCQLCNKQYANAENFQTHTEEPMHQTLMQRVQNCKICNLSYVHFDSYERHLKTFLHTHLKHFMKNVSMPEDEITRTPEKICYVSQNMEVNHYYFCNLCKIKFNTIDSFRRHRNTPIHKNMHNLINKISKQTNTAVRGKRTYKESYPCMHYCEPCNAWGIFRKPHEYEDHLKSTTHLLKLRSAEAVKNWDCSPKILPPDLKQWQ